MRAGRPGRKARRVRAPRDGKLISTAKGIRDVASARAPVAVAMTRFAAPPCVVHDHAMSDALAQALRLSVAERLQLIEALWTSLMEDGEALPVSDAQREELDRRLAAHRADPGAAIPWDEVRARLTRPRSR